MDMERKKYVIEIINFMLDNDIVDIHIQEYQSEAISIFSRHINKNIYIDLFYKNELGLDVESVINVYENKENLLITNGSIESTLLELKNIINKK